MCALCDEWMWVCVSWQMKSEEYNLFCVKTEKVKEVLWKINISYQLRGVPVTHKTLYCKDLGRTHNKYGS